MHTSLWLSLCAQLFSLLVGIIAYKRRSVSISGLVSLLVISALFIWLDHIDLLVVMFAMFASSSLLSHYKKSEKKEFDEIVSKTGPRDYIQAISNLGIATFLLILYQFIPSEVFIAALIGSVAAANADSWASEIGGISKKKPVLITTFKPVDKGISGGVTYPGTIGGIAGSLFIVCIGVIFLNLSSSFTGSITFLFWSSFIAGILGFIFDSYIGAVYQSLYKNTTKEGFTENNEGEKELVKGFSWINNDVVNFLTTLFAAIIAGGVYYLLKQL
jgi:uncharacterized protein (TIGR00297 family)